MVSTSQPAHNVEGTAESLQEQLARLQIQKQALERELAAVVAHLDSVQRALGALQTLLPAPTAPADPEGPGPAGRRRTHPQRRDRGDAEAAEATKYGRLTEQIMEFFATAGDVDVRARDVAAALGRDSDSGSINAVRSTLDRLVGMSRIQRAGRGLYRAPRA
ncbi:hypothetical protein O7599_08045 [Streptomyces sp. WMMC500]|uniref:hypothetical protein n=1 Tax=Streptomyces sp. WMMC500 TaxID=3015154 RepID=UPI00248C1CCF|nr:hypothetical protein [Streptomyces sp. WMMC500]WBB62471.1 hypothetical protein O7599_08045 [Streptomyces sp. WMMC500]